MNRTLLWAALPAALLSFGCGQTTAQGKASSAGGSSTSSGAGSTTGLASGASSGGSSASTTTSSGASTTTAGSGSSSGSTGATGSSSGSTGGSCYDTGYVGAGNQALCCSGQVDGSGYCISASTGGTTTSGTTGSGTSSGNGSTTSGGGLFGGGWHPPDSGYEPAWQGDGGSTTVIGTGADASAPGKFNGAAGGAAVSVLYPPDGVLVPPNMGSLELHFVPGSGQTLFKIAFTGNNRSWVAYTGCNAVGSGCVYSLDPTFWSDFVNYARGAQPVTYTIEGVNGASPGAIGASPQRSIAFSDQDLTAGIYYWNTGGTVDRYDWGLTGRAAETWMDQQTAGATFCVGCHVMSRDGSTAVVGKDIPQPAASGLFDVATRQQMLNSGSGDFFSFSPDGTLLLASDGKTIAERSMTNGSTVIGTVANGTMPDWSPSGATMVYAKPGSQPFFSVPGVSDASLHVMTYNGSAFGSDSTLVPFSGANNYYPAYAPTGDWVAYNVSPSDSESFANATPDYDAGTYPDGELWTVASAGGNPIRLSHASDPGALSWPKWAPVVSDYYGGKVLWLTFSSMRPYGLRLSRWQETQLWMVAFDPAKAAAGQDPSFPAFYLPFQDMGSGNHIAQWVTGVVRKQCTQNSDCPSNEICGDGRCVPPVVTHTVGVHAKKRQSDCLKPR